MRLITALSLLLLALLSLSHCQNMDTGNDRPCGPDNISCANPANPDDPDDCLNRTQLCDEVEDCVSPADEGVQFASLDCTGDFGAPMMFRCTGGEVITLDLLCDGVNQCTSGEDERSIICENKCLLPYYGGCEFTRECVSTELGQNCGNCLTGYTPDLTGNIFSGPCLPIVFLTLDASTYDTSEDETTVQVCVSGSVGTGDLNDIAEESFEVDLQLFDGTAIGGGQDYVWTSTPAVITLTFDSTNLLQLQCVDVSIIDDDLIEVVESFSVSLILQSNANGQIMLQISSATVSIADNDDAEDDDPTDSTDSTGDSTDTNDSTGDSTGTEDSTGTGTNDSTGDSTGTEDSTGTGTEDSTGTGTNDSTGDSTGTEDSTGDSTSTEDSTGTGTNDSTGTEDSTGDSTGTEDSTGTGTNDSTGDSTDTEDPTGDSTDTEDPTGDSTDTEDSTGDSTDTEDSAGDSTGTNDSTGDRTDTEDSFSNSRDCVFEGQDVAHGETFQVDCNRCGCRNGRIRCTRRRCDDDDNSDDDDDDSDDDSDDDDSCERCRRQPRRPVCAPNGYTYLSECFAVFCAGHSSADLLNGSCPVHACQSFPCEEGEICIRKEGVSCFNRDGCDPDDVRLCVNPDNLECDDDDEESRVCGANRVTYSSLCRLLQETGDGQVAYAGRCDRDECSGGPVCGTDGVTYDNVCVLRSQSANARVDYNGECDSDTETPLDEVCIRVSRARRCAFNASNCRRLVRPEEGCCALCGGIIYVAIDFIGLGDYVRINPSARTLDRLVEILLDSGFIPEETTDRCELEASFTNSGGLEITFVPRDEDADSEFCNDQSQAIADRINNPQTGDEPPPEVLQFASAAVAAPLINIEGDTTSTPFMTTTPSGAFVEGSTTMTPSGAAGLAAFTSLFLLMVALYALLF